MPLLFFLLVWPLAEIWLMIQVGQQTGAFSTVLLIVATAVLGLVLVQLEWQRLMLAMRDKMNKGEATLGVVLETAAVGLAGVLLFIPGFISDFLGLLLLLPLTRQFLIRPLKKRGQGTTYQERQSYYYTSSNKTQQRENLDGSGQVLEGEYQRKDDQET
ncbi:FxsA family protein [Marinospirillum insulare]|uniref:Membrane protein FxsA n=1 Tax=Marinospirillum insulare TaxID=217169 RepID=A0ABQ5ZRC3_9GAMM|nr:FxsA family protein [Marinospirillum insulare]GLR62695.1 membrane protein FxsA [Marinospirillum insulare]